MLQQSAYRVNRRIHRHARTRVPCRLGPAIYCHEDHERLWQPAVSESDEELLAVGSVDVQSEEDRP